MAQPAGLIRLALFGSPVRHSVSPQIHMAFAKQTGLKIEYTAIETDAGAFAETLATFLAGGGQGCNVTVPLKHMAYTLASGVDENARMAKAANTLIPRAQGGWNASNTDGAGLVMDLETLQAVSLSARRICILGAGGAVAGILAPLLRRQPAEIVIINRTHSRADELANRYSELGHIRAGSLAELAQSEPFDLVIHATSLGHGGETPSLPSSLLATDGLCYDLNYGHAAEPLRKHCGRQDIRYSDGLGMLVAQAAESFNLWTGLRPDVSNVLSQLRSEVTKRGR
jgi:shikimate dehydrogenase